MFKVCTAANTPGWACPISTPKERLCGAMGHLLTSNTGQVTNQTTLTIRTVFILLVLSMVTSTNGTMLTVPIVTGSHARKVGPENS